MENKAPHPEELTDHCPTCEGMAEMGSFHKGCTVEHGHHSCEHAITQPLQRPGMVPWPASASDIYRELNQRKVVILWEIVPNSDRFQQVMLTAESAGRVEFLLQAQMLRPPGTPENTFIVVTNPNFSAKLDNIPDCYSMEDIVGEMRKGPDYTRP